jgi:hypothetical protein
MMNLASGTVLGLAALTTSPALYAGLVTGDLPLDVALTRYLVAVVVVWLALSAVVGLVGSSAPAAAVAAPAAGTAGPAEEPAASETT